MIYYQTVPVGFEPTTKSLTVIYSTAELWNNNRIDVSSDTF